MKSIAFPPYAILSFYFHFKIKLVNESAHCGVPLRAQAFACGCFEAHLQELLVKVLSGRGERSIFEAAKSEAARHAHGANGVQAISVLHNLKHAQLGALNLRAARNEPLLFGPRNFAANVERGARHCAAPAARQQRRSTCLAALAALKFVVAHIVRKRCQENQYSLFTLRLVYNFLFFWRKKKNKKIKKKDTEKKQCFYILR